MRKQLFIFLLLGFSITIKAQSKIDVFHYKYEIRLSDTTDNIFGIATIYFKANMPAEFLELDFSDLNRKGKGMKIIDLNTPGLPDIRITASPKHVEYWHENDKLKIRLPHKLLAGENDTIAIEYKGIPADGLIISKNKYRQRTFFADNWPNRAHYWLPCIDDLNDKASFEFMVTAPSHYKVISNGILVEEKKLTDNKKLTHWKEDTPLSTKVMVIGVADFAVKKYTDSPTDIPVTAWIYEKDSTRGFRDFDPAPGILKFLINYIGPYPYNKLANVQSKTIFGGMENASAIFYSEDSVDGRHDHESLLAHEISHQWFGDMVTEKKFSHLWLSEGFATYLSQMYMESKYGKESFNQNMKKDRNDIIDFTKYSDQPVVDSMTPYLELLNTNSYLKGEWVLHMLRRQFGDPVFQKIIRSYYETYKGKNADTKDFEAIAEKITGSNLDKFFLQWLYTPGIPHLSISWKYNAGQKKLTVTAEQTQKNDPFVFPLDILIGMKPGSNRTETLKINSRKGIFTFPLKSKPRDIIADPDISVLFEGSVKELK